MKIAVFIGLALIAGSAPAQQPSQQPWVSDADYPPELAGQGKEGLSEVEVVFGPDGRPTRCWMLKSSGTALLDATVCRTLFRRARAKAGEPRVQVVRHKWTAPAQR